MASSKEAKFNWVFRHYAGRCHLNGKNVAVYGETQNAEMRQLRLETIGGKCLNVVNITKDQYVNLREEWEKDIHYSDIRFTQRALKYMGMNEFPNG